MPVSDVIHIVGLAPNPWQGQWVNRQQLLSRLGLKHRVLYSTGARSLWDRDSPEWRGAPWLGSLTPMDNVGVETAPKTMLRWPSWPRYDAWIQAMHARRLRQLSGPGTKSTVAMIFHPAFLTYARCLGANLVAYHAYDLFEATPGWTPELDSMEVELLRRADIVSTVSPGIQDRLLNKGAREVRLLPNGVDLTSFSRTRSDMGQPEDLAAIPHPRLGYVGSLHPQVDYGLVARLAQSRPSWHLVLVGGMPSLKDLEAEAQLSVCRSLPNVHFLGEKK